MIFPHGVNVIKTVVEEPNIEHVLFTKKLNLAESHAKVMQRRNVFATKTLVQVVASLSKTLGNSSFAVI